MISNSIVCRGFVLCVGYVAPNESFLHENRADGHLTQVLYTYAGGGFAASEGKPTKTVIKNALTDLSDFAGSSIKYTAGEEGAAWVALNPLPSTKRYETQLIQGSSAIEVVAGETECAIICLLGSVIASGKTIPAQSYARVLPAKTVALEVPENSSALIIKAV